MPRRNLWLYVRENHMYKEFQLVVQSTTIKIQGEGKRWRKGKRPKRDGTRKQLETQKLN